MPKTVARDARRGHAQIEWIAPHAASEESTAGKAMLLDIREPVEWEHHEPSPEDKETT